MQRHARFGFKGPFEMDIEDNKGIKGIRVPLEGMQVTYRDMYVGFKFRVQVSNPKPHTVPLNPKP